MVEDIVILRMNVDKILNMKLGVIGIEKGMMEWISGNYYDLIWFIVLILLFDFFLVFKLLIIIEFKIGYYYWLLFYLKIEIEFIWSCLK